MTTEGRTGGRIARTAFTVAVLVSLVVLFLPGSGVPSAAPGVDKLVHGGLFLVLALTGRWANAGRRALATALVGYAAASEVLQVLLPIERSAALGDWVADVAGILAGLLLWELTARRAAPA